MATPGRASAGLPPAPGTCNVSAPDRRLLWGVAWAVDLLFFAVAAGASSQFLGAGAVLYAILLAVFMLAERGSGGE